MALRIISISIFIFISIIIETVLLKIFIKKKWYESFKLCTIANLLSMLAYVLFVYLLTFVGDMVTTSWLALLVIPIWVENAIYKKYWKDIPKKNCLEQ